MVFVFYLGIRVGHPAGEEALGRVRRVRPDRREFTYREPLRSDGSITCTAERP